MSYVEEFELDGNVTMDDVKQRVKSWEVSYDGTEYVRLVKSERDIVLIKSKHDMKVCCYPCIFTIISPFFLFLLPIPYTNLLIFVSGYITILMTCFVASYGYFFLGTKKTEFHLTFSFEIPIRVRIDRKGQITESSSEYESLKKTILGHTKQSGPGLLW